MSRAALLIRTHFIDDGVRALIDGLRRDDALDVFALVDERRGPLDFGDIPKVALAGDLPQSLGLYAETPNLMWRCGDYGLYAARQRLPEYGAFWMMEPYVRIHAAKPLGLLAGFPPPDEVDFLAASLRPAESDWNWARTMDPAEGPIWRCLFPLVRLSARAIDIMLDERRRASERFRVSGRDPVFWPNDEVFTASTLIRRGLVCRDLNDFGQVYDPANFSFWFPISERELAAGGQEGRIYHPVLSGQPYFTKLFRLANEQGNLEGLEQLIDSLVGVEWTPEEALGHHRAITFARSQLRLAGHPGDADSGDATIDPPAAQG